MPHLQHAITYYLNNGFGSLSMKSYTNLIIFNIKTQLNNKTLIKDMQIKYFRGGGALYPGDKIDQGGTL